MIRKLNVKAALKAGYTKDQILEYAHRHPGIELDYGNTTTGRGGGAVDLGALAPILSKLKGTEKPNYGPIIAKLFKVAPNSMTPDDAAASLKQYLFNAKASNGTGGGYAKTGKSNGKGGGFDLLGFLKNAAVTAGNDIKQGAQVAGQDTTNALNTVGRSLGQEKAIPQLGANSPTVSQIFDTTFGNNIPGGDLLKGQATPQSLAGLALFAGSLGEAPEASAEDATATDTAAADSEAASSNYGRTQQPPATTPNTKTQPPTAPVNQGNYGRTPQQPSAQINTGSSVLDNIFNPGIKINQAAQPNDNVQYANPEGAQFSNPQPPGEFQPGNNIPNPNANQEQPTAGQSAQQTNPFTNSKPSSILNKVAGSSAGKIAGGITTVAGVYDLLSRLGLAPSPGNIIPDVETFFTGSGQPTNIQTTHINNIQQMAGNNQATMTTKNGVTYLPSADSFNTVQPQTTKIPNDSSIYTHGVFPYQVQQLQNQINARLTNPLQNTAITTPQAVAYRNTTASLQSQATQMQGMVNTDVGNYSRSRAGVDDKLVDNQHADAQQIESVVTALNSGALPTTGGGLLFNKITPDSILQNQNPHYNSLYGSIKQLENDGVVPQGTVTKDMSANVAKQRFLTALQKYYTRLNMARQNYRLTPDYSTPGSNLLHNVAAAASNPVTTAPQTQPTQAPAQVQPQPTAAPVVTGNPNYPALNATISNPFNTANQ